MTEIFSLLMAIVGDHEKAVDVVEEIELKTLPWQEINWNWPIVIGGLIVLVLIIHFVSRKLGLWKKVDRHETSSQNEDDKKGKVRKRRMRIHYKAPY